MNVLIINIKNKVNFVCSVNAYYYIYLMVYNEQFLLLLVDFIITNDQN